MLKYAKLMLATAVVALAALLSGIAGAAELKVLSTDTMQATLQELAPAFEKATGNKVVIAYAPSADVEKKVAVDEDIDVVILSKPGADKLVRSAKLVGGTMQKLAKGSNPEAVYVAGSPFLSEQPLAAKALIDYLAGPAAKKVYQAQGLQTS